MGEALGGSVLAAGHSNRPPHFSKIECEVAAAAVLANTRPLVMYSAMPANDGSIGKWQVSKLSDSLPDLSVYDLEGVRVLKRKDIARKKEFFAFHTKRKLKEQNKEVDVIPALSFQERLQEVQKTLEVDAATISIQLFDNGMVDNDTVSLYFNDKIVLLEKRLSGMPINVELKLESAKENKLALYAHNLGDLAPNTAYMLVRCGAKQYPVHLSGSLEKNAVVVFRLLNE